MLYEYNGPVIWNAHGLKMEKYNEFMVEDENITS